MSSAIVPGQLHRLSRLVRRLTQDNPGLMTGPGTNTYLVGTETVFIVDPGEDRDDHGENLVRSVGQARVAGIAPTHAHPDHWPLAPRLAEALGASTFGWRGCNGYSPDRRLEDGEILDFGGFSLVALHTPGHSSDHLCYFLREERALFSGDHVMGWSTTVIARPDGSLAGYLASLERLLHWDIARIYPAHGDPVDDAACRIRELISHRHMRTEQVRDALRSGHDTVPLMVERIYTGVDPRLHPAAQQSVMAHLEALIESGEVKVQVAARNVLETVFTFAE